MSLNPNENEISVWNKRQNSGKMKKNTDVDIFVECLTIHT